MHIKVVHAIPEGAEGTLPMTHMVVPVEFYFVAGFFSGELSYTEDFDDVRARIEAGRKWDGRSQPPAWGGNSAHAEFEGESVRITPVPYSKEEGEVVMSLAAFEKLLALWERGLKEPPVEADIPELDAMKWIGSPIAGE